MNSSTLFRFFMEDSNYLYYMPKATYSPIYTQASPSLPSIEISFVHLELLIKMAKHVYYLVGLFIIIMDVVAGILGIQAEIAQNKAKNLRVWIFECRDPSYEAFKLGLVATVLLTLAHVAATMLSGCFCIWSKEELDQSSNNKRLAAASHVLSWVVMVIAFSMLISGTLSNSRSRENCGISNHHLLSIGGLLCFVHGLFAVAYYIYATAATQEEKKLKPSATAAAAANA